MNRIQKLAALLRATENPVKYLIGAIRYHNGIVCFIDKEYAAMLDVIETMRQIEYFRGVGYPIV